MNVTCECNKEEIHDDDEDVLLSGERFSCGTRIQKWFKRPRRYASPQFRPYINSGLGVRASCLEGSAGQGSGSGVVGTGVVGTDGLGFRVQGLGSRV